MSIIENEKIEGTIVEARDGNVLLQWYWSGEFWYCNRKVRPVQSGFGDTRDEAYFDYLNENSLEPRKGLRYGCFRKH